MRKGFIHSTLKQRFILEFLECLQSFYALLNWSVINTTLFKTALEKCIHLYDDTQGTIKHKRFRDSLRRVYLIVHCVSSYRWVHFSRAVLFCQPYQQLFTHTKLFTYFTFWRRHQMNAKRLHSFSSKKTKINCRVLRVPTKPLSFAQLINTKLFTYLLKWYQTKSNLMKESAKFEMVLEFWRRHQMNL